MNFIGCALLVLVGAAMIAFSDLFLRAAHRDGINGINATSWDVTGTLIMLIGLTAFVLLTIKAVWPGVLT